MSSRRLWLTIAVFTAAAYVLAIPRPSGALNVTENFLPEMDHRFFGPQWDDGLAEISLYEATEVRYGKPRQATEAALIVVKEDHRSDDMVKADDPRRADLPAIKLNWAVTVPTGIYTYRQMTSVFLNRATLEPFRQTFSTQEWCGSTFKDVRRHDTRDDTAFTYRWSSYFGDEADDQRTLRIRRESYQLPFVFHDALPAWVRSLAFDRWDNQQAEGVTIILLPTLWANRAFPNRFHTENANVRVTGRELIDVPAGRFEAWRIEVKIGDAVEVYHVDTSPWHRLLQMQRADGAVYKLKKSMRRAYWQEHDPGDENLKEGVGVE